MSKAGLLINPKSGRGNGKGVALAKLLANEAGIILRLLENFNNLHQFMRDFADNEVTDLYISSGDGTIQAIQTILSESGYFKLIPRICLLPHGTTNLTAADLGFKFKNISQQADFITRNRPNELRARHSLRVLNQASGGIRHGMTLGVGAAAEATKYTQTAFNDIGVKGNFASFATMGGGLIKAVFTKPNFTDPTRFDKPYDIQLLMQNSVKCEGPQLMLMATTLEKMFFNTKPFWGGKSGPIRLTVFPYPVPSIIRWALPLMYGGENRKVPNGALSFSTDQFSVKTTHSFVMDGEFFEGPTAAPLQVEAGPLFTFICG